MFFVHPNDPTGRRWTIGVGKQRMPNGDLIMTPLTRADAAASGLRELVIVTPDLADNEVLTGVDTVTVGAGAVTITRGKGAKPASRIEEERAFQLRDLGVDLAILQVRLIERLLANGGLTSGDLAEISPRARQAFQAARALADQLDPAGAR